MDNQNPSGAQNPSSAQNFFDDAARLFDKGIAKARTVVSETTIEQRAFTRAFVRMCNDGWSQGWHESNGGNLSYRMTPEEVSSCRSFFKDTPGEWVALGIQADSLRGEFFMVTGAGKHFRSIALDPAENIGIVEINPAGDAWRLVWGLNNSRPTSELPTHLINHAVRKTVTAGACRVVYHAHPANMIALTLLEQFYSRSLSRLLWKSVTECIIAIPDGVGVVGWMVPGGKDIALATSEAIETHSSVVWAQHGVFTTGADFDTAFGLMHVIDKAAGIYLTARAAQGGKHVDSNITDDDLRAMASELKLPIKAEYLD
ncbi:MAG: rhamnulose-1-phosphate aldolase [Raoultibacter sp.]